MNILKFKTNRKQNAYKIALSIKKSIELWLKQAYLISILKRLSSTTKIPTDIISHEIKQILSSNFKFSEGIFTSRLLLRYLIFDTAMHLFILFFSIIFSKNNFQTREYKIIIDDIEEENQAEIFYKVSELIKNSVLLCKKKILFKKEKINNFNIKVNRIFKFYNKKFLYGKKLKLFLIFFHILFLSIKNRINLFFIFNKILYKIIDNETLFSQVKSKILITDRFYKTSSIKNYIFKKNGGKVTACTQKNICEFTISFFVNIDVFFAFGTNYPLVIKKLGGKVKKFVPAGSLAMEYFWYSRKKDLKKIPRTDLLVIGLNYANAPERMYINKQHYYNYYEQFEWIKKISSRYPQLNIILKHHDNCKRDLLEQKILENTDVKTLYKTPSINRSYAYIFKAKQVFSFGSSMILECASMGKNSYFLDPNLENISFQKSIPAAKKIRIKNYNEFEKLVLNNMKKSNSKKIKTSNTFCLKSDKVSKRIVDYFIKNNYL